MFSTLFKKSSTKPSDAMVQKKAVTNSSGRVIGFSGTAMRPVPEFDEDGRLIGFAHNITAA